MKIAFELSETEARMVRAALRNIMRKCDDSYVPTLQALLKRTLFHAISRALFLEKNPTEWTEADRDRWDLR